MVMAGSQVYLFVETSSHVPRDTCEVLAATCARQQYKKYVRLKYSDKTKNQQNPTVPICSRSKRVVTGAGRTFAARMLGAFLAVFESDIGRASSPTTARVAAPAEQVLTPNPPKLVGIVLS